jgi:6-phosphogluconolactonase
LNHKLLLFLVAIISSFPVKGQRMLNKHSERPMPGTYYLFIGSYTNGRKADGIYVYQLNAKSGALKKVSTVSNVVNPSYLTLAPNGRFLYACTETKTSHAGSISSFAFDSISGRLTFINKQPAGGENPVYVTVHKSNKWLVNANYTEGSVSVFPINESGGLDSACQVIQFNGGSVNKERQERGHIHAAVFSPLHDYLFLTDLGADKIWTYGFDTLSKQPLQLAQVPFTKASPGSGPRHFTFHPDGRHAYCIEELSGTVSAYRFVNGLLVPFQRIPSYSKQQDEYASADIHISPDGLFLYASNREDEHSISIFSIDTVTGRLTLTGHQSTLGRHPRNFVIDPSGNFLLVANVATNNVVVFKRNVKTGALKKTGIEISIPNPSCLQIRRYGQ